MFGKKRSVPVDSRRPSSLDISAPQAVMIHGIAIKEQPVGAYIQTLQKMGRILYDVFDAVFPTQKPGEVFVELMTMNADGVRDMFLRAAAVAPDTALDILASVMDTEPEKLKALSPYKLAAVCSEFWKVNNFSDFFQMARGALEPTLRAMLAKKGTSSGSSGSSPLGSMSGSVNGKS